MIQSILLYVLQAVFFIVSLVLYVFLTACLLPKILLIPGFSAAQIQDRGIKKYLFEDGRAMVCQPALDVRPYIPQYILSDNNGERFLKCKLHPGILSLKYRVLTFDVNDRPLQVLEVEDPVSTRGVAKAVPLPLNTAYVSLSLMDVNGKKVSGSPVAFSPIKLLIYLVSTVVMTVAQALMIKQALLFFADLIFAYSDTVSAHYGTTVFTALLIGTVYACFVFSTYFTKGSKLIK